MKKNERVRIRISFDEKVIKNLLSSDADLAKKMKDIMKNAKVKECYAKSKQKVKEKAEEAVEKGVNINLNKVDNAFAEGVHYAFTMSVLGTAVSGSVEKDIQKSIKTCMLETMNDDFMLEIINRVAREQTNEIQEMIQEVVVPNKFKRLLEDIFGGMDEE